MAELGEFEIKGDQKMVPVEVEMLDYDYIKKCNDPEKLRAIVELLKSGKEGYYPDLEEKAEQKWLSVLSEKDRNRILRMRQQASPGEIQQAGDELNSWQNEIAQLDAELKSNEKKKTKGNVPPVRGTKREKLDVPIPQTKSVEKETKLQEQQRLSGYDFRAWEKFDVDAAVNAIDEEEKELEKGKQHHREEGKRLAEQARLKRLQRYEDELKQIRHEMKTMNMSELQRKSLAVREKQKGNEAFKANELNEAFVFYSRSLALDDSIAAVHANRALVSVKLEKLETGEDDATRALLLDPNHLKALSRRGLARLKLGKTALAIEDFQRALDLKPGNAELEQLLEKSKAKYLEVEGHEYGFKPEMKSSTRKGIQLKVNSVSSPNELYLPSHSHWIDSGSLTRVEKTIPSKNHQQQQQQQFTRITIEESEDDDDDDDDEGGEGEHKTASKPNNFTRISIQESDSEEEEPHSTPPVSEEFTRIPIVMDSESDEEKEEEEEEMIPVKESKGDSSFTRIPIAIDESDSEENEDVEAKALALKDQGNEFMKSEDFHNALRCYSESLNLSPHGPHAIASLSNRALVYLQLKNYSAVIEDTTTVLSRAPTNIKALYRRAVAYESLSDLSRSQQDVNKILLLDPNNQQALEMKKKLQEISFSSSSHSSESVVDDSSPDWKIETLKKEAMRYLSDGKVDKAISVLENALSMAKSVKSDVDQILSLQQLLASAYTSREDYQKSLTISEEILQQNPNNFKALSRAGESAYQLGKLTEAKQYATRVLRVDPINAAARVLLDSIQEKENPSTSHVKTETNLPKPPMSTYMSPPSPPSHVPSQVPSSPLSPSRLSIKSLSLSPEMESLSLQKKNDGNEAMKQNNFKLAISLYSEAIEIDPTNMMFFNNRAQAYIKIGDFYAAEQDSTVVIDSNPRLPNLKALFRRSLARKGINTKQSILDGIQDLNAILTAEPANKEAKLEKGKLQTLLNALLQREREEEEERRLREEKERMKHMPKSERIIDESGIVARSTVVKKNKLPESEFNEVISSPKKTSQATELDPSLSSSPSGGSGASTSTPVKSPSHTATTTTTPQSASSSTSTATRSPASLSKEPKKVIIATPTIPTEAPKTVYELERVWRGLKNHTSLFGQYLSLFKKSTFKKVIKETISPDLISSMLIAVKEYLLVTNPSAAFVVLEGLGSTNKFDILLSILPETDLICIQESVTHLTTHVDHERGMKLKSLYHL